MWKKSRETRKPEVREVVTVISGRGTSKRIRCKNVVLFAGKPLVVHSIETAHEANLLMQVFVSSDDKEIATVSRRVGAEIIRRPPDISHDKASSELALLHALGMIRTE